MENKKNIQEMTDIKELSNIFITSLIGIIGLYKLNSSNLLKLNFKKFRSFQNNINEAGIDLMSILKRLYDLKYFNFSYSNKVLMLLQAFREEGFSFKTQNEELISVLKTLPPVVYRNLDSDIKLILKTITNEIYKPSEVVNRLYSYANRKGYKYLDFVKLGEKMKRNKKKEDKNINTNVG